MAKACIPVVIGKVADPACAALFVHAMPVKVGPAPVVTNFTTMEFGLVPVNVLATKSLLTEREANPLGVIKQEQHDTNCSSGEKA